MRGIEASRGARGAFGRLAGVCLLGLLISACSWVEVKPEAEAVGVYKTVEEASACKKVGEVGVNTLAKAAFVRRNETTVAVELERLARNDAVGLDANIIVPLGPVTAEGTRRYAAYRCPE